MGNATNMVDLGFAAVPVPVGTHLCQIYNDADERTEALLSFLSRGLQNGEATACFSENIDAPTLQSRLARDGLSLEGEQQAGRFTLSGAASVYFQGDLFDPDRMLALLQAFHEGSVKAGRTGARVIGEMSPRVHQVPGGSRLMEYESRVNELLLRHPVTAVCQYDAHAFDGGTIMEVLAVHPMMLVRGNVIHNPFYVSPQPSRAQ